MIHWDAIIELSVSLVLSMIIGAEREFNGKAAGMRTCTLVGLGSALFTVVSRNGMWLQQGLTITNVDGSRVAAQIVSGIGFLGAGLIFVRRDAVRGLTTAASVWLVAAVGMACGAGVLDIAIASTILYLVVVLGTSPLRKHLPQAKHTRDVFWVTYLDGQGVLREVMETIGKHGVSVDHLSVLDEENDRKGQRLARVRLEVRSVGGSLSDIVQRISEMPHVTEITSSNYHDD